jgi:hypothetical protein
MPYHPNCTPFVTRFRLLTLLGLTLALAPAAARPNREVVPVPDWTQFDGVRWGPLTLGETTLADFTQRFSSRETDTPGILQANTPNRANSRVYVIFSGAAPTSRLEWVELFREGGKNLAPEALIQQYGAEREERFMPERAVDWRLWIYPQRGVAAVVERGSPGSRDETAARVAGFLFARPPVMSALAERLPREETPVAHPSEPEEKELIAQVGRVTVNATREGEINFDRDRLESTAEYQVQSGLDSRGPVVYDRNGDGRVTVNVRVRRRPDRDGRRRVDIEVNSSMTAASPYGQVTGYGSASSEIEGDVTSGRIRSRASDLAEEATGEAAESVRRSMQQKQSEARQARVRGQMLELAKLLVRTGRTTP